MKKKICIGIYITEIPGLENYLNITLSCIKNLNSFDIHSVLLYDGIPGVRQKLSTSYISLSFSILKGKAYAFNQLISHSNSETILFLENGSSFKENSIKEIYSLLHSSTEFAAVGPKTNRAWNEQLIENLPNQSEEYIEKVLSTTVTKRWTELNPLYSLMDFAYMFKKSLVKDIGLADVGYGNGPCWEMDYNIRAQLCGFKTILSNYSFVKRRPIFQSEKEIETKYFEKNKKIYQDKFCLRPKHFGYDKHCTGSNCDHFILSKKLKGNCKTQSFPKKPLVSCILPTKNRPEFLQQSIKYFLEQDYKNKELVIVYDFDSDIKEVIDNECIKYIKLNKRKSIGYKRNLAVKHSKGDIIVQWDDDDWYSKERISTQVKPIIDNDCDITALNNALFFDIDKWHFWKASSSLFREMFVENVFGGTLAYKKSIVNQSISYPDTSLREDADFLTDAISNGARLKEINGEKIYLYVRHGKNSWTFVPGDFLKSEEWALATEPPYIDNDQSFYQKMRNQNIQKTSFSYHSTIKIACIMPTNNRYHFVLKSIKQFLKQDYPKKELIIIDDGNKEVFDLCKDIKNIKYLKLNSKITVGEKRNYACRISEADTIIHWDDDDWYSEDWISEHIKIQREENTEISGLQNLYYYNINEKNYWNYKWPEGQWKWLHGATLAYKKELWWKNPFEKENIGEDIKFLRSNENAKFSYLNNSFLYMGLIHDKNISPKYIHNSPWKKINPGLTLEKLKDAVSFFNE